jgi:hypothetical protein
MDFRKEWNQAVVRTGRFTMLLAIVCSFLPNIVLALFYGARPPISQLLSGWGQIAAAYVGFYVIEPITYGTVLGTAGSYMGILAGSMGQMRVPACATALDVTNVEAGTDKGEIISTMAIAGSIVTNISILTIFVFFGYQILGYLPQGVKDAMSQLILPALFGAVLMQFVVRKPKIALYALPIVLLVRKFIPMPSWGYILIAVFGNMIISRFAYKAGMIK